MKPQTQKLIQSRINTVKAQLNQVQTSHIFSIVEIARLEINLKKQLADLKNELEVFEAQEI